MERILISGFGSIGGRHLGIARRRFPNADIRVLRHSPSAQNPPGANGCLYSLQDAVTFAPTLSVICSPATLHVKQALALSGAGSHLLIEKPLASTANDLMGLEEAAQGAGITFMLGYNLRFSRTLQYFKQLIDEGVHGRTLSVRAEVGQHLEGWRPGRDYRETVSARRESGGGVLLELSHEIDYLQWIFGPYDWVSGHYNHASQLDIDVEDNATIIMGRGRFGTIHEPATILTMDFFRQDTTRRCTVIGDATTLVWDGLAGSVSRFDSEKGAWVLLMQEDEDLESTYERQWDALLQAIDTGQSACVSIGEGLQTLRIIDAVRQTKAFPVYLAVND